jgi:hypothetical protein
MSGRNNSAAVAAASAPPLATDPSSIRLTRRVNVCIAGTLANFFAEGQGAATWKPIDGKQVYMFGHNTDAADLSTCTNAIKNAYIINCKVLETKSSLPVPVGVTINCIPNTEMVETGERYAFTCLPMSYNNTPHLLFEADILQTEGTEWRKLYSEYTSDNLATHNVLPVNGMPYVFVHENHPIISLLRANSDLLGSSIETQAKIDGEWYKVGRQVLNTCCSTLQSKVLTRLNCQDLNQLQVQLRRLDAREWTDIGDVLQEHMDEHESIFDKPCSFHARLELTYEIPHH